MLNARMNIICYFASLLIAFFTRNILLRQLGNEFIGLTGTLSSLLGFLNLAELGIGNAVGYLLYKPLFGKEQSKINDIISVFGYLYQIIGIFILCCGIIISFFLPTIFSNTQLPISVIYVGFYAFLTSSMLAYFVNYKMIVLSSDQKNYIISGYFQLCTSVKVVVQMLMAIYLCNFFLYFLIEIVFSLIHSAILQWKVRVTYPWLSSRIASGKKLLEQFPIIIKYTKQIFIHKIAGYVQYGITPFLVYSFVSLPMVTMYTNYTLITDRIQSLISTIMSSTTAGIGNLISEGDTDKIFQTYKQMLSFCIFVGAIISFCTFKLITPFVILWLGEEYEMGKWFVMIISLLSYMKIVRGATDQFINGFGLFSDVWAAASESSIFILFSVVLGSQFGLLGVLSGPLISTTAIVYVWKPYFLFKKGFKRSIVTYAIHFIKNNLISILAISLTTCIYQSYFTIGETGILWETWLIQAIALTSIMVIFSLICFYGLSDDFRNFVHRFIPIQHQQPKS